jgi:S-DNA-T family DNA segregation ATPase FtsK/SpoIIIE
VKLFGKTGAAIIDILLTAVFFMLVMGITIAQIRDRVKKTRAQVADAVMEKREEAEEQASEYNAMRNEPRYNIDVDLGPAPKQKPEPKKEISEIFSKKTKPAQVSTSGLDELVSSIAKLNVPEGEKAPEAASQAHTDTAKTPEPNAAAQKTAPSASEQPAAPAEAEKQAKTYTITPVTAAQAAAAMQGAPAPKQGEDAQQRIYSYPPLTLLSPADRPDNIDVAGELRSNAARLVDTLKSFGVETRITDISRGPAVTRYELQPSAGVKISRITSLADDIALNLAASGVRIEAPIPNKAAVGIEVPNKKVSTVHIREILESQEFRTAPSKLTVALGRDIAGKPSVTNIYNMPHVLIAGATGSGKSVCINSIIISLPLQGFAQRGEAADDRPEDSRARLLQWDSAPARAGRHRAQAGRRRAQLGGGRDAERYQTFAECSVRDIRGYNTLAARSESLEPMPQVVVIIDELADLIMAVPGEVEDSICRLAQKARAAGMHLVIATQRPSVDVITGVIKANIPSRIAFAVSSQVDSRTILDTGGAEKLLGRGDMLFWPMGASKPTRIQGCFVSDEEVEKVIDYVKRGEQADYDSGVMDEIDRRASEDDGKKGARGESPADEDDPMLPSAVECVIDAKMASTSLLQRRLKLGYARAARIVDQMEAKGYVGPFEGSKPRAVLITREQWLEKTTTQGQ